MPLYQYKCNDCEIIFERQQRMIEPPLRDCPECEGTVRRMINNVGIVFKGSGFYVTDSRNGNGRVKPPVANGKTETPAEGDKGKDAAAPPSDTKPTASKPETAQAAAAAD